jgi:hypothetical protein
VTFTSLPCRWTALIRSLILFTKSNGLMDWSFFDSDDKQHNAKSFYHRLRCGSMDLPPEHSQRKRRLLVGTSIFIVPLIIGLLSFYIADPGYIIAHDTDTILVSLSAAVFGILVVFYTLTQTDEKRNNEFMAMCTIAVGILFILGMTSGVIILINDSFTHLLEIMVFFNVGSILSSVFVIVYYLLIFRIWHSDRWEC